MKKKPRLNLELDHATKARLDRLQKDTDAASLTEVIRRALKLYEIVTTEQSLGGKLFLKDADGERRVVFL